jgi:hypothetical protein
VDEGLGDATQVIPHLTGHARLLGQRVGHVAQVLCTAPPSPARYRNLNHLQRFRVEGLGIYNLKSPARASVNEGSVSKESSVACMLSECLEESEESSVASMLSECEGIIGGFHAF